MTFYASNDTARDSIDTEVRRVFENLAALDEPSESLETATYRTSAVPSRTGSASQSVDREQLSKLVEQLRAQRRQVDAPTGKTKVRVTDRWEGVVIGVEDGFVEGEFVPAGATQPRMRGNLLTSYVSEDDIELIRPGALFYLISSRVQVTESHWLSTSEIQFRRIPRPKPKDIETALSEARAWRAKLPPE